MTSEGIKELLKAADGLESGEKAMLRRNAHKHLENADLTAMGIFIRLLPGETKRYEQAPLFAAVSNRGLWKEPNGGMKFQNAVAQLKKIKNDSDTVEKRFMSLLDEPLEKDSLFSIKLYRLCRMLSMEGVNVNWEEMCKDLTQWNSPERYIQRKWVREFCSLNDDETKNKTAEEE